MFSRVVSGLQARHVLGVAAWEVEPLEGLAPPQQVRTASSRSTVGIQDIATLQPVLQRDGCSQVSRGLSDA
jgi:hypothetical protein